MKNFLKVNVNYLQYTSPFIILCAVFLFIFFSKLSFGERGEKFINFITPAALGVYLIHTNPFVFDYVIGGLSQQREPGDYHTRHNRHFTRCIYNMYSNRPSENTAFQADKSKRTVQKLDDVFNSKKKKTIEIEEPAIEAEPVEETINI